MKYSWKTYIYAAFFLAFALLLQSLRLIFPMVPPPVTMFVIGSLINMILILSILVTKNPWIAAIGLILPFTAFLQGQLPIVLMVPVVAIGNTIYALLGYYLWQRRLIWIVPVIKTVLLFGGTAAVIGVVQLPVKVADILSFMMSWPQLVTGCMGIIGAQILLKKIPKKIWTAGNQ
jgi:hypothetical protein